MEKKIPVTNNTSMPLYVGASMVPPDETRHFPEHQVPAHLRPTQSQEPVKEPAPDEILALLDGSIPKIAGALPALSDEDYERLIETERTGKARAGLETAFAAEDLRRASAAQDEDSGAAGSDGGAGEGKGETT